MLPLRSSKSRSRGRSPNKQLVRFFLSEFFVFKSLLLPRFPNRLYLRLTSKNFEGSFCFISLNSCVKHPLSNKSGYNCFDDLIFIQSFELISFIFHMRLLFLIFLKEFWLDKFPGFLTLIRIFDKWAFIFDQWVFAPFFLI